MASTHTYIRFILFYVIVLFSFCNLHFIMIIVWNADRMQKCLQQNSRYYWFHGLQMIWEFECSVRPALSCLTRILIHKIRLTNYNPDSQNTAHWLEFWFTKYRRSTFIPQNSSIIYIYFSTSSLTILVGNSIKILCLLGYCQSRTSYISQISS